MSIEKIKKIASEKYGVSLTDEQAAGYAAKHGKLTDDELDNVTGGCDDGGGKATDKDCPNCGEKLTEHLYVTRYVLKCANCGYQN